MCLMCSSTESKGGENSESDTAAYILLTVEEMMAVERLGI